MIDEQIRIQENYDMTMETAIDEAREEGLEQGRNEARLQLIREMISRGMMPELISDMTGLSTEEIETLLS